MRVGARVPARVRQGGSVRKPRAPSAGAGVRLLSWASVRGKKNRSATSAANLGEVRQMLVANKSQGTRPPGGSP
jgi:hypothetical protein